MEIEELLNQLKQEIMDDLSDTVNDAVEDALGDAVADAVENALEDALEDAVEDAVLEAIDGYLPEALQRALSDLNFELKDGTKVSPKEHLRVLSPDKTKLLPCIGGLRVEDTSKYSGNAIPKGWGLALETDHARWENIYVYAEKQQAVDALETVIKALGEGLTSIEL